MQNREAALSRRGDVRVIVFDGRGNHQGLGVLGKAAAVLGKYPTPASFQLLFGVPQLFRKGDSIGPGNGMPAPGEILCDGAHSGAHDPREMERGEGLSVQDEFQQTLPPKECRFRPGPRGYRALKRKALPPPYLPRG